jgi:hypothetical protein
MVLSGIGARGAAMPAVSGCSGTGPLVIFSGSPSVSCFLMDLKKSLICMALFSPPGKTPGIPEL